MSIEVGSLYLGSLKNGDYLSFNYNLFFAIFKIRILFHILDRFEDNFGTIFLIAESLFC
jgi:hypothetical protein